MENPGRRETILLEAHKGQAGQSVHPIAGVDGLARTPDPPHAGALAPVGAPGLDILVDQSVVADQMHRCGRRPRRVGLSGEGLTREETQQRMDALDGKPGQGRTLLISAAKLVTEHVVQ